MKSLKLSFGNLFTFSLYHLREILDLLYKKWYYIIVSLRSIRTLGVIMLMLAYSGMLLLSAGLTARNSGLPYAPIVIVIGAIVTALGFIGWVALQIINH